MVIKKQPVISWLLDENYHPKRIDEIIVFPTNNLTHVNYLWDSIWKLKDFRNQNLDWGLPELLTGTFEKVMKKSAKSFFNMDHQLFQEFSEGGICGILIHHSIGTIVYAFAEGTLYVWLFYEKDGHSVLYNYIEYKSTPNNHRLARSLPSLLTDQQIYNLTPEEHNTYYGDISNIIIPYLAVKFYAPVETIIVPENGKTIVENEIQGYRQRDKIKNISGQEVIVMDSRWFVKIINDNNIFVRGFFRMQNYKNDNEEWDKKLIFVDSFVRHGYHRNAKIEEENQDTQNL